ncbi:MAG TPA: PHP domain-containing protein [Candidatus Bathyarchaeia archaeon]|nr:PHP domain-containing protein [Candidatus Bathyarchaeia archaeon]
MDRVRLDMHMHTEYSRDSRVALADFADLARKAELGAVCITDHDTIEGGLRLREMNTGLQVIVGEEITTADGELVGLYLEKKIAPGLTADHSIDLIHEQGGLAYVPHPFSRNRRRHLRRSVLERVVPKLDIVEVFNAREVASSSNVRALEFARQHSLPGGVGSDSHRPMEIGRAYVDVEPFVTPQELLLALREGKVTGTLSGLAIHVRTWVDIGRKFMRTRVARLRSNAP